MDGARRSSIAGLSNWSSWRSRKSSGPDPSESLLQLLLGGAGGEGVGFDPADFATNAMKAIAAHTTLNVFDGCSSRGDGGVLDVGGLAHEVLASLHV